MTSPPAFAFVPPAFWVLTARCPHAASSTAAVTAATNRFLIAATYSLSLQFVALLPISSQISHCHAFHQGVAVILGRYSRKSSDATIRRRPWYTGMYGTSVHINRFA